MSQSEDIYNLLKDGKRHSSFEIIENVYRMNRPASARYSARIFDVKNRFNVEIEKEADKNNPKMFWYWITSPQVKKQCDPPPVLKHCAPLSGAPGHSCENGYFKKTWDARYVQCSKCQEFFLKSNVGFCIEKR